MPDSNGNSYATVAGTAVGAQVTSGYDVTPYFPLGTTLTTYLAPGRNVASPRLAVHGLLGSHALAGQLEPDGFYHGGLTGDGLEYRGWYAGSSLPANPGYGERGKPRAGAPIAGGQ